MFLIQIYKIYAIWDIRQEKPFVPLFTMHFAQSVLHISMNIENYMHNTVYIFPLMQKNFCRHVFCLAKARQICAQ